MDLGSQGGREKIEENHIEFRQNMNEISYFCHYLGSNKEKLV